MEQELRMLEWCSESCCLLVVSHGPVSPCSHPLSPLQLNHFPGSFQIGRKDRLWRNLSRMQSRFGKKEFSFFPQSFILPQDAKLLRKAWESGSRQKWIVKPVSGPGGQQAGPESGSARVLGQVDKSSPLLSTQPLASVRSRHRHPGHSQVESAPQAEAPSGTEVSLSPAVTPLPASHLFSLRGPFSPRSFVLCPPSQRPSSAHSLKVFILETQRRQLHPTPILLPGKSHGWRSLVGCSPWGLEESDTAE